MPSGTTSTTATVRLSPWRPSPASPPQLAVTPRWSARASLQAVILLTGSAIVSVLAFAQLDFSWARLLAEAPPQHLSLMLPLDDSNLPWLGTLVGVPVLGFYFWCTNQFIVQRARRYTRRRAAAYGSLGVRTTNEPE